MLLSNQQKFLLDALDTLGGATLQQMTTLLQPVFCAEKPEAAPRIVNAAIRQMGLCNVELCRDGELVFLPGRRPGERLLEAVDVMLELSGANPLSYFLGKPPILLRFSVQEQRVRLFAVIHPITDVYGVQFYQTERVILLFGGQDKTPVLPVSNKQFIAVRQEDGSHRFYAVDGETQRR